MVSNGRVRPVIEMRVGEGELDDCNLTLGIFHNRVDYPPMVNPYGSPHKGDANGDHRVHPLPGVAGRSA